MYYSTYFNNKSYYSQKHIKNQLDYLMSSGEEGIEKELNFRIKNTALVKDYKNYNHDNLIRFLEHAEEKIKGMEGSIEEQYTKFFIPKRSGGRREILAPSESLKVLQETLVYRLKYDYRVLEHNSAHAYTEKRSIVTNAEVHKNNFNFINVDLTNFFPSITKDIIKYSFKQNANLHEIFNVLPENLEKTFFDIILYNGALPQGSKASPFISNLVMIPFDYNLNLYLKNNRRNIVYTRYVDDLTFSSKPLIYINDIIDAINWAKEQAYGSLGEFIKINNEKTRKTTYKGKNRVTGIKINAENNLSIGYKEKQRLKMDMVSLIINKKRGHKNDYEQVQQILGMFSYLQSVEEGYAKYLLRKWSSKFEINNVIKYLSNS